MENINRENMDMSAIGKILAEVSASLADLTKEDMTRNFLRTNARRLELGAVRLAVLGDSNAGKSTLINALLRTIAVPESGSTATPIPVWFTASDVLAADTPVYNVYIRTPEGEKCETPDRKAFLRENCYCMMDTMDDKRARFIDRLWASAGVDSPFLRENGYTLIDTLGTDATAADTAKTIATIDIGMDVVLYVSSKPTLSESNKRFLREHVLGLGERKAPYPLKSRQILLVYNDHGNADASRQLLENSAEKLLEGLPEDEIAAFKQNNIVMLNALTARRDRCGAYDYEEFAPEGTLDLEMEGLKKLTRTEQRVIDRFRDKIAEEAKQFDVLEKRLAAMAHEIIHDRENGAVERRIAQLETEINVIRKQANDELAVLQSGQAEISRIIAAVREKNATFAKGNEAINKVFDEQRAGMRKAISETLKASKVSQEAMLGRIQAITTPPTYINTESVKAFNKMSGLQQEEQLAEWIQTFISEEFLPEASKEFKKLLLEANIAKKDPDFNKQDTVGFQVEAARKLAMDQGTRMRSFCLQLEEVGAGNIGLMVPTDETIDGWFASMASAMETAILEAIARLRTVAQNQLNGDMPRIMNEMRKNTILKKLVKAIQQLFGNIKPFWQSVREKAMEKAAQMICEKWFNADPDSNSDMFGGIDAAYCQVQEEIVASLNRQTAQVKLYLKELETGLGQGAEDIENAKAKAAALFKELDALEERLNALRDQMN